MYVGMKYSFIHSVSDEVWEINERIKYKEKKMKSLSRVRLFATPWTVDYQAPPSMGFFRQECWSGLPFSSPGIRCRPPDQRTSECEELWPLLSVPTPSFDSGHTRLARTPQTTGF